MSSNAPGAPMAQGQTAIAAQHTPGRYRKLAVALAGTALLMLIAGFVYDEQAGTYDQPYLPGVLLQIVYETPFQPLFLIIALVPIYLAAARNVSWIALASGGLMMLSLVLPYARFLALDVSSPTGPELGGFHNSLFQLAGPGHQMPQFVSIVVLILMGGMVALFWRTRVGGLIGLVGAITMIFVWPAAYDDPPTRGGEAEIIFFGRGLLFGYYIAWAGAILGILGQWLVTAIARRRQPGRSPAGPGAANA